MGFVRLINGLKSIYPLSYLIKLAKLCFGNTDVVFWFSDNMVNFNLFSLSIYFKIVSSIVPESSEIYQSFISYSSYKIIYNFPNCHCILCFFAFSELGFFLNLNKVFITITKSNKLLWIFPINIDSKGLMN